MADRGGHRDAVAQVDADSWEVAGGLATLGPLALAVARELDECFRSIAASLHAEEMSFPQLVPVGSLQKLQYFNNFPHIGILGTPIDAAQLDDVAREGASDHVSRSRLADAEWILPSAACINVYFHLSGTTLDKARRFTTRAQCFRNEAEYSGLKRLRSFSMRELVCVGPEAEVEGFVKSSADAIRALAEAIGLELRTQPAMDPFYDPNVPRARMQKATPVKNELLYKDVAVASSNLHGGFFAERCDIKWRDGGSAFSGCVGMGLERWILALHGSWDGDLDGALRKIVDRVSDHRADTPTHD
jgi:seryl-tRNA synthetase